MVLLTVLFLGFINNFNYFINEGCSPDVLNKGNLYISGTWELQLGRFGIAFIDLLKYGLVNKFINIFCSLIFISLAIMVIIRIFSIKNKLLIFIISASVCVFPQFTELFLFHFCADSYCFALLLSVLSGYFLKKSDNGKIKFYILAIICIVIECSIYQAFLGVSIVFAILLLISDLLNNEDIKTTIIKGLKYLITILLSAILYYVILQIILAITGLSLESYKGANGFGIETIKNIPKTIIQAYKDFFDFFFSNRIVSNSYWKRKHIYLGIFLLTLLGYILIFAKVKYKSKALRILCTLLLLIILPIGANIMDLIAPNTKLEIRTAFGIIVSFIFVFIIYNKLLNEWLENLMKYAYIILIFWLIATFILQNTLTYMNRQEVFNNYYTKINNIYNQVLELDNYSKEYKWMFSDTMHYKAKNFDKNIGGVANWGETWYDYVGMCQNKSFLKTYLGVDITICSKAEYDKIVQTEEFKEMPVYPQKGSIKIINDIIVIKVSNNTFK